MQARMRVGAAPIAVLEVAGHGRLRPASRLLSRPPWGVKLTEFGRADSPRTRADAIFKISALLVVFLVPCVFIGALWGIAYLATLAFASWLWFGLTPPGWLPGGTK